MLRLPPFEYQAPNSIAEAVALKAECGDSAMFVSGGTDLFPNMKRRQFTPKTLIGLRKLAELRSISLDDSGNGLMIGLKSLMQSTEFTSRQSIISFLGQSSL